MASNSRFDQIVAKVCADYATIMGYRSVVPQSEGDDGFLITDGAPQAPIRVYKGNAAFARNERPPRIVFVPVGGEIKSPDIIGGKPVACIRVRYFGIRVFCWGGDFEWTESLLHNLILAIEGPPVANSPLGAHNAVNFSEEVWTTQLDGQGGDMVMGEQVSFIATYQVQVTTLPDILTRVQHLAMTVTELDDSEEITTP